MCGIAGILNLDGEPASPVLLRKMTDAIAHRGPDGEGVYADGAAGLGHRRLAIIDLTPAGHQPMSTADGRYTITYNGEVYHFQELRVELEERPLSRFENLPQARLQFRVPLVNRREVQARLG